MGGANVNQDYWLRVSASLFLGVANLYYKLYSLREFGYIEKIWLSWGILHFTPGGRRFSDYEMKLKSGENLDYGLPYYLSLAPVYVRAGGTVPNTGGSLCRAPASSTAGACGYGCSGIISGMVFAWPLTGGKMEG